MCKRVIMVLGVGLMMAACAHKNEDIAVQNTSALDMTTSEMAQYFSGGSVEVYDLDGAAPSAAEFSMRDSGGIPAGNDSSVTVYPFDGGATPSAVPPGMMPLAEARQDFPSPFKDGAAARILFEHNSTALDASAQKKISDVAHTARGPLLIEGHASTRADAKDPVERHIVNLKTAMDRAFNVSRELMRKGVPAESLETTAYGDTRPAPEGEAASRRVDIYNKSNY